MESEYENSDVDNFTLYTKKILDRKDISMYFLQSLNPNFHDDLLSDAVELLV